MTGEALARSGSIFRDAAESGAIRVWECDEGILYAGLRAAGQGLPFFHWKAGMSARHCRVLNTGAGGVPRPDRRRRAPPPCQPCRSTSRSSTRRTPTSTVCGRGSGFGDRLIHRAAERTILTVERLSAQRARSRARPLETWIPYADGVVQARWGAHPLSRTRVTTSWTRLTSRTTSRPPLLRGRGTAPRSSPRSALRHRSTIACRVPRADRHSAGGNKIEEWG